MNVAALVVEEGQTRFFLTTRFCHFWIFLGQTRLYLSNYGFLCWAAMIDDDIEEEEEKKKKKGDGGGGPT